MTQRSTILIVDDEPFNVDYLEQELEYLGYDTESAANGREALEKVAASAPDLILLDVMMPGIDGFTVCRMLKDDRKTRLIPIIIMTALNSTEDRVKGIEAGADDFLTKPVNELELIARIKTALRIKHAVDAEIGELRKVSDHLAKFVPDTVTRLIAANPSNPELEKREQDISILFLDITGYGRLSEAIAPEVLNMLIERYFSAFFDRIQESGGEVSGSAGDGLMAIFQDGDPNKHAITAADTALALFATNDRLNAENSIQPLGIHIGINSGRALVGPTRYHGQRGVRWVFTADGPVINLAARLADVATDGEIVAGPETVQRLGERYQFERRGHVDLKNIAGPVENIRILRPAMAKPELRRVSEQERESRPDASRRLGTILATEMLGDTDSLPGTFQQLIDGLLGEHRGRVLETIGASFIAEFGSPLAAVRCAVAIQRALRTHGQDGTGIGLGLGRIIVEGGRVTGDGVDVAAGLKELAKPGDICVSHAVYENVRQDIDGAFEDGGEQDVAGLARPVRMYRLQIPNSAANSGG